MFATDRRGVWTPAQPTRPIRLTRRTLLRAMAVAGVGVVLSACGDDGLEPFATPAPTDASNADGLTDESSISPGSQDTTSADASADQPQTAVASATTGDQPAFDLPEPLVYLIPSPVTQGQTVLLLIEAPGAEVATMSWQGQMYSLLRQDDRFLGFFGIDANAQVGPQALGVSVWGPRGQQLLWQETVIEVLPAEWTVDDIQIDGPNAALLDPAIRQEDVTARLPHQTGLTPRLHWLGVFDPPADGAITALYGEQRSFNGGPISEYHTGIDFAGETGAPVRSANAGIVSWAGRTRRRGNGLIVDHGAGVFSGYYHLSEVLESSGVVVEQGDLIGRIGATGLATGPHLHWEVVVRGVTVNPLPWLRSLEFPDPHQELSPSSALNGANLAHG